MSEDPENNTPEQKPTTPQKPVLKAAVKNPLVGKPSGNPFLGKTGVHTKGKAGPNTGFKGKIFKGSGVKKGK